MGDTVGTEAESYPGVRQDRWHCTTLEEGSTSKQDPGDDRHFGIHHGDDRHFTICHRDGRHFGICCDEQRTYDTSGGSAATGGTDLDTDGLEGLG